MDTVLQQLAAVDVGAPTVITEWLEHVRQDPADKYHGSVLQIASAFDSARAAVAGMTREERDELTPKLLDLLELYMGRGVAR